VWLYWLNICNEMTCRYVPLWPSQEKNKSSLWNSDTFPTSLSPVDPHRNYYKTLLTNVKTILHNKCPGLTSRDTQVSCSTGGSVILRRLSSITGGSNITWMVLWCSKQANLVLINFNNNNYCLREIYNIAV